MKNLFLHWRQDLPASLVVFLVALPLCLGIAVASGAPPVAGIIAGVVGGLVVGLASGSPLGVSGPAAGIKRTLAEIPEGARVVIDGGRSVDLDPDVREIIQEAQQRGLERNVRIELVCVQQQRKRSTEELIEAVIGRKG